MSEEIRTGPAGKKLGATITTRFVGEDADLIYAEAERRGMTLAEYVRWAALQHVGEPIVAITQPA